MSRKIVITVILQILVPILLHADTADAIARLQSGAGMSHASVGICILDISSGRTVAACNEHLSLIPASVTKIVTAATAFRLYPDTMRWYTQAGYSGRIDAQGTLQGDIIIRGCIDPSLAGERATRSKTAFADSLAAAVQRAGIKAVAGRIIADASLCEMNVAAQWLGEDTGWYYGAGCYGINYRNNRYDLFLQTGGIGTRPVIAASSVPMPMITYHNHLTVGSKDSSFVAVNAYTGDCVLSGTVPADRKRFRLPCSMPDPPLVLAYDIRRRLQSAGISVPAEPATDCILREEGHSVPPIAVPFCSFPSETLSQMIQTTLWHSDNLYAEALLRYIGLSASPVAQTSTALITERDLWKNAGLDVQELNLFDGCGLARKNTLTPRFIATLLAHMYNADTGRRFISLFPQAGQEGTVRSFLAKNPLPGTLRLKSGSMSGVLCYAGYYTTSGHTYAVVLMSNHHTCRTAEVRLRFEQFLRTVFSAE